MLVGMHHLQNDTADAKQQAVLQRVRSPHCTADVPSLLCTATKPGRHLGQMNVSLFCSTRVGQFRTAQAGICARQLLLRAAACCAGRCLPAAADCCTGRCLPAAAVAARVKRSNSTTRAPDGFG